MKTMAFLLAMAVTSATFAAELPVGSWHMVDAACSNPNYQYKPEEQAMRDAVLHKGNLWTDDDIVLTSPLAGTWQVGWTDDGMGCTYIQDMAVSYLAGNRVSFKFTNGRVVQRSEPTENREITCSATEDATEEFEFELTPAGFDFILGRSADCGEYRFKFVAWP